MICTRENTILKPIILSSEYGADKNVKLYCLLGKTAQLVKCLSHVFVMAT